MIVTHRPGDNALVLAGDKFTPCGIVEVRLGLSDDGQSLRESVTVRHLDGSEEEADGERVRSPSSLVDVKWYGRTQRGELVAVHDQTVTVAWSGTAKTIRIEEVLP